jgi:hypothetical protein
LVKVAVSSGDSEVDPPPGDFVMVSVRIGEVVVIISLPTVAEPFWI